MYKLINNSTRLPKFVKVLLDILLTLSCVYLIGLVTYKILEGLRICIHYISDKRNWWTFMLCILLIIISALLLAQFYFDLDPFGNMVRWFNELWSNLLKDIGIY